MRIFYSLMEHMHTSQKLIDIHGLQWSYTKNTKPIFDHLDMTIEKDDFCFVVGKSGVGKTTLVKFLIRQLKPPTKMIFHKKEDIARFGLHEVQQYRSNIGVVFQDFKLIEWKDVAANIAYPLEIAGVKKQERDERVDHILDLLDMQDKKHIKIPLLSGGEKQRVAIGRAIINQPEFIIADEPTGNLDRDSSMKIADTLIDLNKKGNTIVLITHNQQLIDYVSQRHTTKTLHLQ